ncbi:MFS transporter [Tumebacillus algifaecis]|uniref:MFS transporter n=1 Tax=Tumebacillus algifaecis TaxID=1214604 RepID=A0A223CY71_9BACL|nr:MDR family MFS transporter [Tumebacillus algifaecis]ASS74063.1 MFS transporter [Tumebacillus algifaecis]
MVTRENKMGFVVAGLLLGILMAAMDNTIVATAMGTIVGDLGGLEQFVWVTSAYLVASMAGMPIFGKLSDMYGRKRFFIFGLIVFLIGSVLCGIAQTMTQLAVFRAIQGIGGGALMPIAFTIIFDLFPPEQRGKMTGLFGAVFGTSSIFGPLLGAWITEGFSWHWIFYVNVPIGIIALFLIIFYYKESVEHSKQKIDYFGSMTLVGAVICLMFGLELGGNQYAWGSAQILTLFAGFAVLLIAFLLIERKVAEPVINFSMFKNRLFFTSNMIGVLYGAAFIVATIYIPIFVQGVLGGSATNSGLILLPMTIGSVVAASIGGMITGKMSYRNVMIISGILFIGGSYLLSTVTPDLSNLMLSVFMVLTGLGVGMSFSVLPAAAVHGMDFRQRGQATSTNSFLRTLGMTLGISIFGIIQRNAFTTKLEETFSGMGQAPGGTADPRTILSPEKRVEIPAPILEKITDALSASIATTFLWTVLAAVLAFVFILAMSKSRLSDLKQTN